MVAVGYPGNKGQPSLKGMRLAPRSLRSMTTTSCDCRSFMTISIKQKEVLCVYSVPVLLLSGPNIFSFFRNVVDSNGLNMF